MPTTSDRPGTASQPSKLASRAAMGCAGLALAGFAAVMLAGPGPERPELRPAPDRASVQPVVDAEAASENIRPCDAVGNWQSLRSVTCTTDSATLTIVRRGGPLLLGDIEARITGSRVISADDSQGPRLWVRMRMRNQTSTVQVLNPERKQVYLAVGGQRVTATGATALGRGEVRLGPQDVFSGTLEFPLDEDARGALRLSRGHADLGVLPFSELGKNEPHRFGVMRVWASIRDAVIDEA